MEKVADFEIWRQIPPEEKLAIMSRSHACGIMSCLITIVIASTLAIGLKAPILMWGSFIISPLVFQFAAGKAWRSLRPRMMLEYLAARSAARRYAFAANGTDLGLSLIFKGELQEVFEEDKIQEALESMLAASREAEVWVALFNDSLIMMAEKKGGASCEFAAVINDKLSIGVKNGDEDDEYTSDKELYLSLAAEKGRPAKKFKLTSRYPGALVVFEKKLQKALEEANTAKSSNTISFKDEVEELTSDY